MNSTWKIGKNRGHANLKLDTKQIRQRRFQRALLDLGCCFLGRFSSRIASYWGIVEQSSPVGHPERSAHGQAKSPAALTLAEDFGAATLGPHRCSAWFLPGTRDLFVLPDRVMELKCAYCGRPNSTEATHC